MKTPTFWQQKNAMAYLLYPLGKLYAIATRLNLKFHTPQKVSVPVICIGNLTAGGSGKTPTAIAIASMLQAMGYQPFFVSRGYGGKLKNVLVDINTHTPKQVGDEPLLLAQVAPVVVNPDRFQGAQTAISHGADIIIMDDGFQNPKLNKDLSFLVFDGTVGYGNGYCVPAGPLREELSQGIKRAQAMIIIGDDKQALKSQISLPCFEGKIAAQKPKIKTSKVIAFAGIGRPEKFFQSLKDLGIEPIETIDFPDHHFYTTQELENLIQKAQDKGCSLITTSKDFVKIPHHLQSHFHVLEITIKWQNAQELSQFIKTSINEISK